MTPGGKNCAGDGCYTPHSWPLHNIRYRGALRRFCTSCVLKSHPGSFCSSCLSVFDTFPKPAVVSCSKCPSISHPTCIPNPHHAFQFLCRHCSNPDGFYYYRIGESPVAGLRESCEYRGNRIDAKSAKALLTAAQIAAASMRMAAMSARSEAERKVKDAMVARTRARDMLARALVISHKEREKMKVVTGCSGKPLIPSLKVVIQTKKNASKSKKKSFI